MLVHGRSGTLNFYYSDVEGFGNAYSEGKPQLLGARNSACGASNDTSFAVGGLVSLAIDGYRSRMFLETGSNPAGDGRTGYARDGFPVRAGNLPVGGAS